MGDGEVLHVEGGLAGERPAESAPLPNRTDAAFAELDALRTEATELGLTKVELMPLAVLRDLVAQAKAQRAD